MRAIPFALKLSLVATLSCGEESRTIEVTLLDTCRLGSACEDSETPARLFPLCGDAYCTDTARFATLAVFAGGCPGEEILREGNWESALRVLHGDAGEPLPSLGELDASTHGFAGVLRSQDCGVVGFGCTEADLSVIRKVRVEMAPSSGGGACEGGDICKEGSCEPAPSMIESTCSPKLAFQGELPDREGQGSILSGPGVVATDKGYLVGYREDLTTSAEESQARVKLVRIDRSGQATTPIAKDIDTCPGIAPGAGLGMAVSMDQGLLVTPQPACEGRGAGATFVAFAPNGTILDATTFAGAGPDLSLSPVHALAPGLLRNSFELAYISGGSAYRLSLLGARPQDGFVSIFPDKKPAFVQLASSPSAIAYLAGSPTQAGGEIAFGVGSWQSEPSMTSGAGFLGAVAAYENRAISVAALSPSGLRWEGRASDGTPIGDGYLETEGSLTAVDIAVVSGEAIVAAARSGGLFLASLGEIGGEVSAEARIIATYDENLGDISLSSYDGRSLALAAHRDGFALTWLNSRIGEGPVGGFALFDCAP